MQKSTYKEWPRDKRCWRSSESSILHLIIVYFVLKSRSWLLLKSIKLGATAPGWFRKLFEKTSFHKGSQEEVQTGTDHVCGLLRWNWESGSCFIYRPVYDDVKDVILIAFVWMIVKNSAEYFFEDRAAK